MLVLATFLPIAALAQFPRPSPDWPAYEARAVERLRDFLRINTSNTPGNEQRAADFFCDLFSKEGMECQVFEIAPGRANAYARLRGDGSRRPIILLNHTDVVTADAKDWSVRPFSAEIRDGAIYGRGAQGMKAVGMLHAMAMVALKREGVPLARDVVFLAVADKEVSSTGSAWMLAQKPELLAGAEYLINEGGENMVPCRSGAWTWRRRSPSGCAWWPMARRATAPFHCATPRRIVSCVRWPVWSNTSRHSKC